MAEEQTVITSVSAKEIDDLLNLGGAENVITPVETKKTPFTRITNDVDIDMKDKKQEETPTQEDELEESLTLNEEQLEQTEIKPEKSVVFDALSDLVKDDTILLFEEEKELKDYSKKELIELFKANQERVREEESAKAPAEFFDSLPLEMQYAAKYIADGGKDIKGLFKHLSNSVEIKDLDITTERGQEEIVRQYLSMTEYGTPEEIEAELTSYKDMPGALEKKAGLFKPKLDAKQQQRIDKELKDQEIRRTQQEEASVKYRENILKALTPGVLNEIKITPTIAGKLFNGLTQANYPSVSGRNTNLLGHLLEKNQYVEPNPQLIAEVLWLLDDPKGYREAVKGMGAEAAAGETFKELKKAGASKTTNTSIDTNHQTAIRKTIKKPQANIFARTK